MHGGWWRVQHRNPQEPHQIFNPRVKPSFEQMLSKVLEVAFESAPAAFLQMWALVLMLSTVHQSQWTLMQLLSILISVLTASFVVASASCESRPLRMGIGHSVS